MPGICVPVDGKCIHYILHPCTVHVKQHINHTNACIYARCQRSVFTAKPTRRCVLRLYVFACCTHFHVHMCVCVSVWIPRIGDTRPQRIMFIESVYSSDLFRLALLCADCASISAWSCRENDTWRAFARMNARGIM